MSYRKILLLTLFSFALEPTKNFPPFSLAWHIQRETINERIKQLMHLKEFSEKERVELAHLTYLKKTAAKTSKKSNM